MTVTTSIYKLWRQVDPPMPRSRRLLINVYVNIQTTNQRNSQQWWACKTPSCICQLCIKFEFCCSSCWKLRRVAGEAHNMTENALSILIVIFSLQLQQTEISERKLFIFQHGGTPPAIKQAPLTMLSSSSRCVLAAEHHTAEQDSKPYKTKPQKHLPMSNLSWKTHQDFLKIPSLWEAAMETERRCFSKVNLESNVTPNISRSSDSFSTVLSMVRYSRHCFHKFEKYNNLFNHTGLIWNWPSTERIRIFWVHWAVPQWEITWGFGWPMIGGWYETVCL